MQTETEKLMHYLEMIIHIRIIIKIFDLLKKRDIGDIAYRLRGEISYEKLKQNPSLLKENLDDIISKRIEEAVRKEGNSFLKNRSTDSAHRKR